MQLIVTSSRQNEPAPLAAIDRLPRLTETIRPAVADLHEDQLLPFLRDQIDLPPAGEEVGFHDPVSFGAKKARRLSLRPSPSFPAAELHALHPSSPKAADLPGT